MPPTPSTIDEATAAIAPRPPATVASPALGLVVHLLEQHRLSGRGLGPSTEAMHLVSAAVRALPDARHVVVLLGDSRGSGLDALAPQHNAFGCRVERIGVPMGRLLLARPALLMLLKRLTRSGASLQDVVLYAYSREGARLARSIDRTTRGHVLLHASREMPLPVRLVGSVRPRSSRALRERLAPLPAFEDRARDRVPIRDALGIAPDTCVISLVCAQSPQQASNGWMSSIARHAEIGGTADARWFVFLGGILIAGGINVVAIVPRRAGHLARARRFHATTRLSLRVIVAEEGLDHLLPACDLALWHDPMASWHRSAPNRTSVPPSFATTAAAHASGVPVIATTSQSAPALYPPTARESCLVPSGQLRHFARAIALVMADPSQRVRLSDSLRAHMAGISDDPRFATALRETHARLGPELS